MSLSVSLLLLCLALVCVGLSETDASMNLTGYTLTWNQDFSLLDSLSVSAWGPVGPNGSTWIAHTPYSGDWCHFADPAGDYNPFYLPSGGPLVIRAQKVGDGLSTGLLSSVDPQGRGFAQKYGYFEMKARLPSGSGVWPAFWMMDTPGLLNASLGHHELDVLEAYGDGIGILRSTLHWWDPVPKNDWGLGFASPQCSMTKGFHTYGMDIQEDYLTFYYDRQMIWQQNNSIPNGHGKYDRPLYVMVNLAYGGGGSGNNVSYILDHPQDMLVDYVRVWQGNGGSANAADYSTAPSISWWTATLTLMSNQAITISGTVLLFGTDGRLHVTNNQKVEVYVTDIPAVNCTANCSMVFQNDGNLVFHNAAGQVYWGSSTWNNNEGMMTLSYEYPYLEIFDNQCNSMWTIANKTQHADAPQQHQPLPAATRVDIGLSDKRSA